MPPSSRRHALVGLASVAITGCDAAARVDEVIHARATTQPPLPRAPVVGSDALDTLADLAPDERRAFTDERGFAPLPPARPREWRTFRRERAQSVDDFLAADPVPRTAPRDGLALLPLGGFPFDVLEGPDFVGLVRTPPLADLAEFVAAFFATRTTVLPTGEFPGEIVPHRPVRGHRQYDATALLHHAAPRLPHDAHGMVALVTVDLFAWAEQEFAFGFTLDRQRLAVVGFSRYDPSFFGGERPDDLDRVLLRRGLKVLVHEIGHVFGLAHCLHFRCAMNGIADLPELDRLPLHLCPVCLRKLQLVTDLDPRATYRSLLPVAERLALDDEVQWLRRRLALLA
jgi:archaemetzincin